MPRPSSTRLLALTASAVGTGLSYAHALQAPGKRELGAADLMRFQTRVLAPYKTGAGVVETAAIATGAGAVWAARGTQRSRALAGAALAAHLAAFTIWAVGIEPINRRLSTWTPATGDRDAPADWQRLRDRWHRPHTARLAVFILATTALALSAAEENQPES